MRTELKRVGAVIESDEGELMVVKRSFRPAGDLDVLVNSLIHGVYPLLSTVCHNTDADRDGTTRAQRIAFSQNIKLSYLPIIRRTCLDRIHDFTKAIDDSFIGYEKLGKHLDLRLYFQAECMSRRLILQFQVSMIFSNASSSKIFTPSSRAFASLDPGFSPATT